ncbi:MAG: hypothetical protein ACLQDL_04705 [Spirochaetia bacterium]
MWWTILFSSLATLAVSIPGHLLMDRLWSAAFGPPLDAVFRNRRRTAALRAMWLDFINMCATNLLALFCGFLILSPRAPRVLFWIPLGIVTASSAAMIAIISTRAKETAGGRAALAPATPMMAAGSMVAILLGIIVMLTWEKETIAP